MPTSKRAKSQFITISRQYGSGGRELSRILADKIGVKRYDRKAVAMAAEQVGAGDPLTV
ncbi:MAG: cytidylate kinase family protein [Selenomonas sp.]|nr:cytidylate kinase family protein [Selenomonas sp.]